MPPLYPGAGSGQLQGIVRRTQIPCLLCAFILGLSGPAALLASSHGDKPNIVFILADDLGWRDLGCYGSYSYDTPNIDQLAAQGIRFTSYYAQPSCSPTRSSLMSGMDAARLGIVVPNGNEDPPVLTATIPTHAPSWQKFILPTHVNRLDTRIASYADLVRKAGYVTGHFGKWHLGREPYSPLQHGFDVDIPHVPLPGPGGSYIAPWNPLIEKGLKLPFQPGDQLEDHMALEAAAFINANKDKPFLLNYWAFSVHSPLNAKDAYVNEYRNLADGQSSSAHALQRNPVYAAMVKSLDDAVGTLMDALQKAGIADKTIVIFSSDNGGLEFWDGGGMAHTEYRGIPATNNVPLRSGKGSLYEGGVRVPLIVKWPGVVKPASESRSLAVCMDIYPTLLQMAGTSPLPGQPLDGVSLVPILKGTAASVRDKVFCVSPTYTLNYAPDIFPPRASIHDGDWKLLRFYGANPDDSNREELYNLKDDIGETFDLSAALPDLTKKLSRQLDDYIARIHVVMPVPNPKYDPHALPPAKKRQPSEPLILPADQD